MQLADRGLQLAQMPAGPSSVSPASMFRLTQKPGFRPAAPAAARASPTFAAAFARQTPWNASTSAYRAASATASGDSAGSEISGRGDCTGFTPENAPRTW